MQQYNTQDHNLSHDAARVEKLVEEGFQKGTQMLTESARYLTSYKKDERVKVQMTSGPSKDIENVRQAFKQGADEKQARNIIRNGEFVQGQNKGPDFMNRLNRYELMVMKRAEQANRKELVEQKFGPEIWEQAKQQESQSQSQSHDLGL